MHFNAAIKTEIIRDNNTSCNNSIIMFIFTFIENLTITGVNVETEFFLAFRR